MRFFATIIRTFIISLFVLSSSTAWAIPMQYTIDTSALSGTNAFLAFDFIDGGTPSNTVTVSSFATDGTLGSEQILGDVSGTLPSDVILGDASFFNEYLQEILLGSQISFILDDTGNTADASSFPDGLSFFLLDQGTNLPLVSTDDPTGAGALFLLSVGEQNGLSVYSGDGFRVSARPLNQGTVPEPNSVLLILTALTMIGVVTVWRKRHNGFKSI